MRFIKPNKTTRGPSTIMGLAVARAVTVTGDREQVEEHRALQSHLVRYRLEEGKLTRRDGRHPTGNTDYPTLIDHLIEPGRQCWLWGYRVGELWTMLGLWEGMMDAGWKLSRYVIEDPPTILHYRKKKAHLVVLDTCNWVDADMQALGAMTGLCRQPFMIGTDDELTEHFCPERDAEIVAATAHRIISWVRAHDLGVCQKTAPAQALQAYRHRFGPRVTVSAPSRGTDPSKPAPTRQALLPIGHDNKHATELENAAYYGGDCRCFFVGEVVGKEEQPMDRLRTPDHGARIGTALPLYHLDISAFYPSIMHGRLWPCELDRVLNGLGPSDFWPIPSCYCWAASVLIDSPGWAFPCRIDGQMTFATGRFWTTLIGDDLIQAVKTGSIADVSTVARYHTADLFTRFVDEMFYTRRKAHVQGDVVGECMTKKVMNSLYGKFAQRTEQWVEDSQEPALKDWGTWIVDNVDGQAPHECRAVAGVVQVVRERKEAGHSFPAISAAITAAGRQRMARLREAAGLGNVYYQDTDSLIVNALGCRALVRDGKVRDGVYGSLRVLDTATHCEIRGPRDYTFGDRVCIAGQQGQPEGTGGNGYVLRERERLPSALATSPGDIVRVAVARHSRQRAPVRYHLLPSGWTMPLHLPLVSSDK